MTPPAFFANLALLERAQAILGMQTIEEEAAIAAVVMDRRRERAGGSKLLGLGVLALGTSISLGGIASGQSQPAFEVASVKPSDPNDTRVYLSYPAGRFAAHTNIRMLIQFAYDIANTQMSGGPDWVGTDRYDIEAKLPSPLDAISGAERTRQIRLMTRGLLAARFGLMVHLETRRQRIYELVVAKGGSKLRAADPTKPESVGIREGEFSGSSARLDALTKMLTGELGRVVIDKTALSGPFDFSLAFAPTQDGAAPAPTEVPSIFTAIQEQLGLKLEPAQGLVKVLVVDRVDKPGQN